MRNILKSDFYKLKKSKAFWICAVLSLVLGVFLVIAMQAGMNIAQSELERVATDPEYRSMLAMVPNAGGAWMLGNILSMGLNTIFVGVFVGIFVSSEFVYGTMKNTISRGAGRIKVFASKFFVCACAALLMLLTFMAAALVTGTAIWGFDPNGIVTVSGMLGMILPQVLLTLAFTALFTFISTTLRSSGGAMAVNIICVTMASTLLSALNTLFGGRINLNHYWIGGAMNKLATITPASDDIVRGVIIAVCWRVAALLFGTIVFKKRDVK
ncbi:ABC transporter permease [Lachnospiraceae bacterium ZAX-1]